MDSFTCEIVGYGDEMYPKDVFPETIWGLQYKSKDIQKIPFFKYMDAKKVKITLEVIE